MTGTGTRRLVPRMTAVVFGVVAMVGIIAAASLTKTPVVSAPSTHPAAGAVDRTLSVADDARGAADVDPMCASGPLPEAGFIQFSPTELVIDEGGGERLVLVTRTGGNTGPATAMLTSSNGSATAEVDYKPVGVAVSFAMAFHRHERALSLVGDRARATSIQLAPSVSKMHASLSPTAAMKLADHGREFTSWSLPRPLSPVAPTFPWTTVVG